MHIALCNLFYSSGFLNVQIVCYSNYNFLIRKKGVKHYKNHYIMCKKITTYNYSHINFVLGVANCLLSCYSSLTVTGIK